MEIKFIYLACRVYGSQDFSKTWRGDPEVWMKAEKGYQKGILKKNGDIARSKDGDKVHNLSGKCKTHLHFAEYYLLISELLRNYGPAREIWWDGAGADKLTTPMYTRSHSRSDGQTALLMK